MGTQSTAKTIFLLASMGGWLIVGAALMYLCPALVDWVFPSATTHLWMENLGRGGYNPLLALGVGGLALMATTLATVVWYQRFEGRV